VSSEGTKKINRRQLLAGAAVGAAGLALSACASAPQAAPQQAAPAAGAAPSGQTFSLKMQSTWTATDWHHANPTSFVERVNRMSAGRLKIELLPAGAVVPALELLDAVHNGILDAGNAWPGYWFGKHPAATLFGSIPGGPFGMNNDDYLSWMYVGGGIQMYNELYQNEMKMNLVGFPSFGETPEPLGWFNKPVKTVADFRGLKFRAGGMSAQVFTQMGMQVVQLPGGEIVPALERGTIDAAEFSDPTSDMSVGFHEVRKFYHLPSVHQPTGIMENFFNKTKWDALPDDLKAIIEVASQAETMNYTVRMLDRNATDLLTLVDKHGVTVVESPPEIMQEILKAWDAVAAKHSGENPFFKKVYDSQRDWARRIVPYRRVGHPDYNLAADFYWGRDNVYKVQKP
jgi:TRAP-type mannitol/chloroaromatic compound transport system substrate-binding protein